MVTDPGPLSGRPKPILACICSDFQAVAGGGFNLIRIYDSVELARPDGLPPDTVLPFVVQAVTCWTEGIGAHRHQLRLLDEDGHLVAEAPLVSFTLTDFNVRHWVVDQIFLPVQRSTRYTVEISLDDEPDAGLRYVFTVMVR